jgi:hypothetical protein
MPGPYPPARWLLYRGVSLEKFPIFLLTWFHVGMQFPC